nr:hypothetical protein [Tanacetum cinerariifolium]
MKSDFDRTIPKIADESSKRAAKEELEQESSKRQKTRESSEPREKKDDELTQEDLQQMVMIVPVEEVYVEALQKFNRDDLAKLWDLVKERFSTTKPTDDKEKELWVELKRLFKPDNDDTLWKLQRGLMTLMLVNKLLVEQSSEMANELLRKIFILANRPRQYGVWKHPLSKDGLNRRNLMINKMNIKFRRGLLRIRGFYNLMLLVQVSTTGYKSFYCWLKKLLLVKIRENSTKY